LQWPGRSSSSLRRILHRVVTLSLLVTLLPIFAPSLMEVSTANGDGLNAFYRNETRSSGDKDLVNPAITVTCNTGKLTSTSISWSNSGPAGCNSDNFVGYYTGFILGPKTGTVNFSGNADDSFVLRIGNTSVIQNFAGSSSISGSFTFVAGQVYPIQMFFGEFSGAAYFDLYWDATGSATAITSSNLATTAAALLSSPFQTDSCQIGYSALCPAYSPQEIYNLYGTTTDGNYWIMIGGAPSLQYVLMSRSPDNGGWMLAMKGTNSTNKYAFSDTVSWEQATVDNIASVEDSSTFVPTRIASNGTGTDAKYDSFNGVYAERIRAIFPQYAASTYGGRYTSSTYGFIWDEALSSLQNGAATYNTGTGQFGESRNCTGITTRQLVDLFRNSLRCLFRTPASSYTTANSANYDPIGNNLFGSQSVFRWWGINYRQASSNPRPARFGFGWNENGEGDESSNDVTGGIGLADDSNSNNWSSGNYVGCCATQNGQSAQFAFELYVRQKNPDLGAPLNLTVTSGGSGVANLSWNAPSGVTATEYVVQYKASTSSWTTGVTTVRILDPGATSTAQITGLNSSTSYNFRVFARTVDMSSKLYDTNSSATAAEATRTLQTISFAQPSNKTLGMSPFSLSATASSSLTVSFQSTTTNRCTTSGTTVTLISAGLCSIQADQAGDATYAAATSVTQSFTISETLTITTPSSGLSGTYGSSYFLTLSASGGSGNNSFSLFSGSLPSGLSLSSGGIISGTPTVAGSSAITVRVTDSNTATATTNSFTLTIDSRTITITAADRSATYTGSAVSVSNTYSITSGTLAGSDSISALTYTFTSIGGYNSTTAPTTAGTYTITPSSASLSPGTVSNYAFSYDTATLTIAQATQSTLTITSTTVAYGETLTVATSGGSGSGDVSLNLISGNCTVSGVTLTPTATGSCLITATKASDTNYQAVTSAQVSITITTGSATATISFSSTTFTFGTTNTITITASTAGSVRFSANGKLIKYCKSRSTALSSPFTATCSYRPSTRRPVTITATLTPTNLNIAEKVTTSQAFLVTRRTSR